MLEMLHAVIVKNPRSVVDEQSQTFFVHLVVCLANDRDNEVRLMAGEAIKRLTGCVSPRSLLSILEYSLSWYLGEKQQLWGAAAQVYFSFWLFLNSEFKVTKPPDLRDMIYYSFVSSL